MTNSGLIPLVIKVGISFSFIREMLSLSIQAPPKASATFSAVVADLCHSLSNTDSSVMYLSGFAFIIFANLTHLTKAQESR